MEPYLDQRSYQSEESFYQILRSYFLYAKKQEVLLTEKTIVVLPEYIGTWLVAAEEDSAVFLAPSVSDAMQSLIFEHPLQFLWTYIYYKSYANEKLKETLFRMKAIQMASIYQSVFSRLSSEFKVGIVAGSIVLPEPKVIEGKIVTSDGPLQNVSFYFRSNGELDPSIVRKKYLLEEEKTFLSQNSENQFAFATEIGKLQVLICADSWYPDVYLSQKDSAISFIAVPSFVSPQDSWKKPWNGYNGFQAPNDVKQSDMKRISELHAWRKYGMLGRAKQKTVNASINVFFRGRLWDLDAGGSAFLMKNGKEVDSKWKSESYKGRIYAIGI
ncbi:hydrolase, carbon-nitrogen family [Leptospira ryugenii]|uniref:Hydrolase, carbon-nitrogen family n=1 Tax=Leptospira ryugenii TaxID=1917863 RepID=A0A2P2E324_9LEPT|nr:carbon-nitrogen hydrolase family protein [Leptospira ryugenii]GBF51259.1 hydrolase, carbon-nitrogen family [Leptospira ryugenii]